MSEEKKAKREKTGGRTKGTPNKITATVKMMVLEAFEKKGGVKWLMKHMDAQPVAFMSLLGRIMPTQVIGDVTHRFVARVPATEESTEEWLKKYSPPQQLPHEVSH